MKTIIPDTFKFQWSIHSYDADGTIHYEQKKEDEPLSSFLKKADKTKKKFLVLDFLINKELLSELLQEIVVDGSPLEHYSEIISTSYNDGYFPFMKLQTLRLLGEKISPQVLNKIGYEISKYPESELNEFIKQENTDIQLFSCAACLSRDCSYFPLKISKKKKRITWKLTHYSVKSLPRNEFAFDYDSYYKEFLDLIDFLKL